MILAAGESKRLGTEKQLLPFKDTFLLNYIIRECRKSRVSDIYTILGHQAEKIHKHLGETRNIFINENYKKGLGNSMSYAVSQLITSKYSAIVFVLCDQIYFNHKLIEDLISKHETDDNLIVASKYSKTFGPPVLFSSSYYSHLKLLDGYKGARNLIAQNLDDVGFVYFENGEVDIDTIEDLSKIG